MSKQFDTKETRKKAHSFWEDFKKFVSRGNVVDMAVGLAVASAFTAIVSAFTAGFITPLLALVAGDNSLAGLKIILRAADEANGVAEVALLWGDFVQAILDFLIIAFSLFLVLRIYTKVSNRAAELREDVKEKLEAKFDADDEEEAAPAPEAPAEPAPAPQPSAEEALLTEIRDLLRDLKKEDK